MRIRGQASLSGGTTPLYVVDGMPIVGDISTINPDEIESISVLKTLLPHHFTVPGLPMESY